MSVESEQNQRAWEYRAYEFWNRRGTPMELAGQIMADPMARLRHHQPYFQSISGLKIANPCGSNGRRAVPLALLGAEVTVFDISQENRRYAMELAECAGVKLRYELGDFCETPRDRFGGYFDMAYAEGGILHYFHEIDRFMNTLYWMLKPGGRLVLSDFHPVRKIVRAGSPMMSVKQTEGDYFDARIHSGDVAYQSFFTESEQSEFPNTSLRFYTLSEILNAVIRAGLILKEFNEHPSLEQKQLPGEFTLIADKPGVG